mgnify:CR=1 FL=1
MQASITEQVTPTDFRKAALLMAYREHCGNVSKSAKAAGVNRDTFYHYKNTDPAFAAALSDVHEDLIDTVEGVLWDLFKNGKSDAIRLQAAIHILRAKAKDRGYGRACPGCSQKKHSKAVRIELV